MIYTVWGSALARVSVVDMALDLVLDVIVRPPHRIADCNTRFSGLTPELLETAECDLDQVSDEQVAVSSRLNVDPRGNVFILLITLFKIEKYAVQFAYYANF